MSKVCFVILHFKDYEATANCLVSLINNVRYDNLEFVVVENGSDDNSCEILINKFKTIENIHFLINEKNVGYARGNNLGYSYAKSNLKADFVIILNNDTEIRQENFVDIIINTFYTKKYHVLGPDIFSIQNKIHQSPIRLKPLTQKEVSDFLIKWDYFEKNIHINKFKYFIKKLIGEKWLTNYRKIRESKTNIVKHDTELYTKELSDVVLHGACVIFSPIYLEQNDNAFLPDTFLYLEEDILTYLCIKNNYKIIYLPEIKVFHYEDLSTNKIMKNEFEKELFKIGHQRNSAKVYLQIMNDR